MAASTHGGRAKCLQRLIRLGLPVPKTVSISFDGVRHIATGHRFATEDLLALFGLSPLVSVRPSSEVADWGGPGAILNIGMNDARHAALSRTHGAETAEALYLRFIQAYAVQIAHLDASAFVPGSGASVADALAAYEEEMDEPFPQDPARQLIDVLRSMARAWDGTSARLLRQAKGAPADAGLGLVVQQMALGVGPAESGAGVIQFIDDRTGLPQVTGRYLSQSQGRDALSESEGAIYLTKDPRGRSLEELCPELFADLIGFGELCRKRLREEMQIEFTIEAGRLAVLDAVRVPRSARANVRVAVALADDRIISKDEAVLRVPPHALIDLLHRQVDEAAPRDVFSRGIAASPGAATGRIVFSATAAQAAAAREEPCILVKRETKPEDIRGMHASVGVLTERGGMTSHAAVIARGIGLPCVVGASGLRLNTRERTITGDDGRVYRDGDVITIDGSRGEALAGAAALLEPALDDAFRTLLGWADAARDIGVRANADTPADARTAREFAAEGIGLCRTEHMFFEEDRLTVMREMIFAGTPEDRAAVLERLLPMQRADFVALFEVMRGQPVCIRLFDPPLHEFLPDGREGLRELADVLNLPLAKVTRRVEALAEFNPMLGMRGVRLGITIPEIYDVQARAIFEAAVIAGEAGAKVVPEVMIPLVSAKREVELVKSRIDAVAAAVRTETGQDFDYRLGVMVETPRACLRADEIAQHASFLSFGTNDLTQMTYGLSRDDAGRFMGAYVREGVYLEDPFHRLDLDGVGELLMIAAERGKSARGDITLSICGEHGGDPEAIAFCRRFGFDYVSCSPFRVPVARLAAAHLALAGRREAQHQSAAE
ncbi:MAG: PEP-utilizing enzyme [Paracoccaceae bacterium]|nr:PEP-utilizing enzyme [Paracoccaceae bacterium]